MKEKIFDVRRHFRETERRRRRERQKKAEAANNNIGLACTLFARLSLFQLSPRAPLLDLCYRLGAPAFKVRVQLVKKPSLSTPPKRKNGFAPRRREQ